MNERFLLVTVQLLPIVLIGLILPWTGRSRRGLLFGVTVSLDFAASPTAAASLRRFRVSALVLAGIVTVAAALAMGIGTHVEWVAPVAVILELGIAMVLWQRERRRMLPHGIVVPLERSAGLAPSRHAGAMLTTASALLPIAVTCLWLHTHWSLIPDRWPQHWNAAGHVNGWGVRSTAGVYLPLFMGAFVVASFVAMVGFMAYAPGSQGRQRERILPPMTALTWTISLFFCTIALLPLLHLTTAGPIIVLIVLHTVVILGLGVWMVLRCGFMSLGASKTAADAYDGTPDARWYGGIFYYNPEDAAVLVPKRYGWGWTLNFARPATWVFTAAIVGFAVLSIWLPRLLR